MLTTNPRFAYWAPRVACAIFALTAVLSALWPRPGQEFLDLNIYHGAERALFAGRDPYAFSLLTYPFTYPPFALLALAAAWVPVGVIEGVWLAAGLATTWYLARALARRWPDRFAAHRVTLTFGLAALLFATGPVRADLDFGQISLFMVAASFADAIGRPGRRWGGVAIGLCGAIKLTPLFFLPWLVVVGRGRDAARALATFLACTAVAWLVAPGPSAYYWGHGVWQTSRVGDLAAVVNQSLHGLLVRSGMHGRAETICWLGLGGAIAVLTLMRAKSLHRQGLVAQSAILAGCCSLVVSPVTWSHHETWTVLAAALLVVAGRRTATAGAVAVLVVALLPVSDVAPHVASAVLRWPLTNSRALVSIALCLFAFRTRPPDYSAHRNALPSERTTDSGPRAGGPAVTDGDESCLKAPAPTP
jgi:alpha-1,2-mannosyltransferase